MTYLQAVNAQHTQQQSSREAVSSWCTQTAHHRYLTGSSAGNTFHTKRTAKHRQGKERRGQQRSTWSPPMPPCGVPLSYQPQDILHAPQLEMQRCTTCTRGSNAETHCTHQSFKCSRLPISFGSLLCVEALAQRPSRRLRTNRGQQLLLSGCDTSPTRQQRIIHSGLQMQRQGALQTAFCQQCNLHRKTRCTHSACDPKLRSG